VSAESGAVEIERRGPVLVITLNRPEVRNAVNEALAHGLAAAVDQLDSDDQLRAGVLTGAGKGFCAGMDLKAFVAGEDPNLPGRGFAGIVERPPNKPLIAAIEGFAVAGGLEIALTCDLIVAARDARFGLPEVKRGLVPAAGGLLRLPRAVPQRFAAELALTGELVPAERAERAGLVNRLCEPGQALAGALDLAEKMAANAPLAMAAVKRILAEQRDWKTDVQWAEQARITGPVFESDDCAEGARAFAENREPVWRGR
jgi:enoyl-CoA hydratase